MTNILDQLGNLGGLSADVILEVLGRTIGAIGTGTEWSGEQIDRLGELQQLLGQKITELRG